MKRLILSSALGLASLLGGGALEAQLAVVPRSVERGDTLEVAKYRILYELQSVPDVTEAKRVVQDVLRLDVGEHYSKEYSYTLYQADSASAPAMKAGQMPRIVQEIVPPYVLYKGYPKAGELTVDHRLPLGAPVMTYQIAMPELEWSIGSETKTLAGYECIRATTHYAGRDYEAWFAPDIPLKGGPYKFGGLPGLILEIKDTEGHYHFTCIDIYNLAEPIVRWNWKPKAMAEAELKDAVRKLHARLPRRGEE